MMPDSGCMVAHILSVNGETHRAGSVRSRHSVWNKREHRHYNASARKSLKTGDLVLIAFKCIQYPRSGGGLEVGKVGLPLLFSGSTHVTGRQDILRHAETKTHNLN